LALRAIRAAIGASSRGRVRLLSRGLGFVLHNLDAGNLDPLTPNRQCLVLKIDIGPTQAKHLTTAEPPQGELPGGLSRSLSTVARKARA